MYQSPIEEKVKTLIEKYRAILQVMEDSITVIKAMKGDTNSDIEDLRKEMAIANTDIRMYSKFIKDLENLIG